MLLETAGVLYNNLLTKKWVPNFNLSQLDNNIVRSFYANTLQISFNFSNTCCIHI